VEKEVMPMEIGKSKLKAQRGLKTDKPTSLGD
jgi:hypothetical protein